MSKGFDLKAIFGDPDNISSADNPAYQFHDHMDEIYISGLPENFPCVEFQNAFEKNKSGKIKAGQIARMPAGIWFAQLEEDRTTIIQMIFEDVVKRDFVTDIIMESVDNVLCQMGIPLSQQSYYMVPMIKQNYDEALLYMNSRPKPSSDLN